MMLVAVLLGTTAMVSAQTTPAKAAPAKEVKQTKAKKEKKAKKVETMPAAAAPEKATMPKK